MLPCSPPFPHVSPTSRATLVDHFETGRASFLLSYDGRHQRSTNIPARSLVCDNESAGLNGVLSNFLPDRR